MAYRLSGRRISIRPDRHSRPDHFQRHGLAILAAVLDRGELGMNVGRSMYRSMHAVVGFGVFVPKYPKHIVERRKASHLGLGKLSLALGGDVVGRPPLAPTGLLSFRHLNCIYFLNDRRCR